MKLSCAKQFTRKNSKTQLISQEGSPEDCRQGQGLPVARNSSQQLQHQTAGSAADPYCFDIEDNTANVHTKQPTAAPQAKVGSKRPCSSISTAAAAASRPADPAERQPSPPKQPRPAGAQHVTNVAQQRKAGPQHANTAAQQQQQQQRAPAAPASQQHRPAQPKSTTANTDPGCATKSQQGVRGGASGGAKAKPAAPAGSNPGAGRAVSGGSKAASGGSSRRPQAAGSKRGRAAAELAGSQQEQQQQQQQQQLRSFSSPPDSATHSVPSSTGLAGNSAGAVSLPTPHRRSRLSAGLLAAAAAAGGVESRPAQTVMEAQERGELVQMQDDASYAMDGLAATCSVDTQRDSAVSLTEMLSTRKGRVALRQDGLAQQFLTNLAKLKAAKDSVLGLAATLSLWYLSAEDANPCYLASVAAAVLVDQLLQYDYTFEEVSKSSAGAKLCRLVRLRPLTNLLASTGVNSSKGLLLVTLEQATNSQHASKAPAVEKLKHNLRQHGALQRLAAAVADASAAPGGPVAASKQLHLLLLVLENATFTRPDNGSALADLHITPGGKGGPSKAAAKQKQEQAEAALSQQQQAFPAVLVGVAQQLLQGIDQEQSRAALHALLSVMMNLIHDNKQGGALLCANGGMAVAADTYSRLLLPCAGSQEGLCAAVLAHLELVSVALGVLMNLVSNEPQHSRRLAAVGTTAPADPAAPGSSGSGNDGGGSNGVSSFVRLLCTVMTALGRFLQHHQDAEDGPGAAATTPVAAAAAAGGGDQGVPSDARVVTSPSDAADALGSNTASEASIVELYSGILLGFLVRDGGRDLAQPVAALLPGGTLDPLTSATGRCLDFYLRTGAITDHTRVTLEQLLRELQDIKAGMGPGGGGQAVGAAGAEGPEVMEIE